MGNAEYFSVITNKYRLLVHFFFASPVAVLALVEQTTQYSLTINIYQNNNFLVHG